MAVNIHVYSNLENKRIRVNVNAVVSLIKYLLMNFITSETDKFNSQTIHKISNPFVLKQDVNGINGYCNITMELQFSEVNVEDKLVIKRIRLLVTLINNEWWFLRNGKLMFLAGSQKITILPANHNEETGIKITDKIQGIKEMVVYLLEIPEFKKICDAVKVSIQISGDKWKHETDVNKLMLKHFRAFYHELIDKSIFKEEYIEIISFYNKKANISKKSYIIFAVVFLPSFLFWFNNTTQGKWFSDEHVGFSLFASILGGIVFGGVSAALYQFIAEYIAKRKTNK